MTPEEVGGIMGVPERTANLGEKLIYFDPKPKVTFKAGKLVDVEGPQRTSAQRQSPGEDQARVRFGRLRRYPR